MASNVTAIAEYLRREYGGDYQVATSTVALGVAPTRVVDHKFERMGLTMINVGANPCYLSPDGLTSTTHGIFLAANGGVASLNVRDDLALVGYEWYGIQSGGATSVYAIEVVRYAAQV